MTTLRPTHTLTLAAVLCGGVAYGCDAPVDKRDNRINIADDGSFENANLADPKTLELTYPAGEWFPLTYTGSEPFDAATGGPIRDHGDGRVAQTVRFSTYGCKSDEAVLFTDCNTGESILLFGKVSAANTEIAGAHWATVDQILPPLGPIEVTAATTVDRLARTARRYEIRYLIDARRVFAGVRKRDAFDSSLGCKRFYPDSPGAQS